MAGKGGKRPGAGRKAGIPNKANAEIKSVAQQYSAEAIEKIVYLMRNAETEQVRLAAAKEIVDRVHGRPAQSVEHTGEGGGPIKASVEVTFVSPKRED